ncbi:MAG: tetratricopeptide repeat protein [Treponema sp.]|nr:tetratricopeptide repeat protein [Treponema sp.]
MSKINNKLIKLIALCSLLIVGCSTAPKNPLDIRVLRNQAEVWLEMGNKESEQGRFTNSLRILTEAKNNAVLSDDSSLIIRVCLSRGNVLFSLNRQDEAFAEWRQANSEAMRFKNVELISVSKIFLARGNLLAERQNARSIFEEVNRESDNIKVNRMYIAFSWQVRGLALRILGSYTEAESAFKSSLEIHFKDGYLENAAYDWYMIASIRSLSKNTDGALQALEESLILDRRIENSWGIASSYRAMGDIYTNMGQRQEAITAYTRAKTIYETMKNEDAVKEINKRLN